MESLGFTHEDGNLRELPALPPQAGAASGDRSTVAPRQFAGKLGTDGVLSLKSDQRELGRWVFSIIPDDAPEIRFTEQPKRAPNGGFEVNYAILDDHGAVSAEAEFALADTPAADARPLYSAPEMELSLPSRGDDKGLGKTIRDLSDHVWAGADVKVTLKATDAAGQEARSDVRSVKLPERPVQQSPCPGRAGAAPDACARCQPETACT